MTFKATEQLTATDIYATSGIDECKTLQSRHKRFIFGVAGVSIASVALSLQNEKQILKIHRHVDLLKDNVKQLYDKLAKQEYFNDAQISTAKELFAFVKTL